jgi:flagellar motility protein MotE (MotC chaperone)
MKLMDGYSPMVIGIVLLVAVLAFGLYYTRPTEAFTNMARIEGFNQEQMNASCKTIEDQLKVYKAELQKTPINDGKKKLQDNIRESMKQMENIKQQYGC